MFQPKWKRKPIYEKPSDRLKYLEDIDQIVCWLREKHNVEVIFDKEEENTYDITSKIITINSNMNYRCQLHTLLHEAGHFVLNKNKKNFNKQFPFATISNEFKTTRENRIDILREEVFAWEKGLDVAKLNHINISKVWYYRHMRDALYSYVEWVCKKKTPKRKKIKK